MIGDTEDALELQKRFITGGDPAKLEGATIMDYFFELNQAYIRFEEMKKQALKQQQSRKR